MIYIWVRPSVDWEDEEALEAEVRPDLRRGLELWDATFNLSLGRFRSRVREIAELNHSRVDGAVRARWDEIPDGALVLPVDDDDWFAPEIASVLESRLEPGAAGCYWVSSWIEVPIDLGHRLHMLRHRLLRTPLKWICTTNNYAMVKGPDTKDLLANHLHASRWFEAQLSTPDGASLESLEVPLSVANRTLGSISTLRGITRRDLLRKRRRYERLYRRARLAGPAWRRPYVAMMGELMDELELQLNR